MTQLRLITMQQVKNGSTDLEKPLSLSDCNHRNRYITRIEWAEREQTLEFFRFDEIQIFQIKNSMTILSFMMSHVNTSTC